MVRAIGCSAMTLPPRDADPPQDRDELRMSTEADAAAG
jgi:hypothetical protein